MAWGEEVSAEAIIVCFAYLSLLSLTLVKRRGLWGQISFLLSQSVSCLVVTESITALVKPL